MPVTASRSRKASGANTVLNERKAIESAFYYFRTLFPDVRVSDPSLEEIEMSEDGKCWLVTLGFEGPRRKNPNLPDFLQVPVRKLKVFKVDARTGKMLAMKLHPEG